MTKDEATAQVAAERMRQISVEGWTAEHDDEHNDGALLRVAVFYYLNATRPDMLKFEADGTPVGWQWDAEWWKPKNRTSDLIRAGALCMAERDRLSRALPNTTVKSGNWWPPNVRHKYNLIVTALQETWPGDDSRSR